MLSQNHNEPGLDWPKGDAAKTIEPVIDRFLPLIPDLHDVPVISEWLRFVDQSGVVVLEEMTEPLSSDIRTAECPTRMAKYALMMSKISPSLVLGSAFAQSVIALFDGDVELPITIKSSRAVAALASFLSCAHENFDVLVRRGFPSCLDWGPEGITFDEVSNFMGALVVRVMNDRPDSVAWICRALFEHGAGSARALLMATKLLDGFPGDVVRTLADHPDFVARAASSADRDVLGRLADLIRAMTALARRDVTVRGPIEAVVAALGVTDDFVDGIRYGDGATPAILAVVASCAFASCGDFGHHCLTITQRILDGAVDITSGDVGLRCACASVMIIAMSILGDAFVELTGDARAGIVVDLIDGVRELLGDHGDEAGEFEAFLQAASGVIDELREIAEIEEEEEDACEREDSSWEPFPAWEVAIFPSWKVPRM
jgi:hypothetical protein